MRELDFASVNMQPSAFDARLVLAGNERPSLTMPPVSVSHTLPRKAASTRLVRVVEKRFVSGELWKPMTFGSGDAWRRNDCRYLTVLLTFCSSRMSSPTIVYFEPGKTLRAAM